MATIPSTEVTDTLLLFFKNGYNSIATLKKLITKRLSYVQTDLPRISKNAPTILTFLKANNPEDSIVQCIDETADHPSLRDAFDVELALWAKLEQSAEKDDLLRVALILDNIADTLQDELAQLPAKTDEASLRQFLAQVGERIKKRARKLGSKNAA